MSTLDKAKSQAIEALRSAMPEEVSVSLGDLTKPPQADMGDLAFPCFAASKILKGNPVAIAKEMADKIVAAGLIGEVRAFGPYINFFFNKQSFATGVLEEVFGRAREYGHATTHGAAVLIEYGSPNTHKEIHVGHLRNFALGLAVERLLRAAGAKVTAVNYIGDVGAHVAKWLWYFKKTGGSVADLSKIPFGKIYTEATVAADADEEKTKPEIGSVLSALEAHEPEWEKLWLETRDECLRQMDVIFKELDIHFSRTYLESEVEGPGKDLVKEMLAKGIAIKGERDAVIVDLNEPEDLGVFLVLKGDGNSLYSTKELALAGLKFKEYSDTQESIHVVDNRQSLYFKQLFATLKRLGFTKPMSHLAYDFVTLAEGAMSSRKGNIVRYEEFRDAMVAMATEETKKRRAGAGTPDSEAWDDSRIRSAAWAVAEGAMKFGMLKQDNDRAIVFDMQEALSFDGFTGPYIQYAHARLSSILAKAEGETVSVCKAAGDEKEYALLRVVADLPGIVTASAVAHRPSLLAQYLFELAQAATAFYRDVPVLSAEPADRSRRLVVTEAARVALENGLRLLGIRAPREM